MTSFIAPSLQSLIDNAVAFDIETKTDFTTFRMSGFKTFMNDPIFEETVIDTKEALENYYEDQLVVTWNGARFDIPFFYDTSKELNTKFKHFDLMIAFKMLFHDEKRFSLDHWAQKIFGRGKLEVDYDSASNDELKEYLERDLNLTIYLFRYWVEEVKESDLNIEKMMRAVDLETKAAELVAAQVRKRVQFDMIRANDTLESLNDRIRYLTNVLCKHLPVVPIAENKIDHPPVKQFKKDGSITEAMNRYIQRNGFYMMDSTTIMNSSGEQYSLPLDQPLQTVHKLAPNMAKEIKEYLLNEGWEPTEWNTNKKRERTSPRLTLRDTGDPCPNLLKMGVSWVPEYREYLQANNRRNVLQSDNGTGWIPIAAVNNNTIPSDGDSYGANTSRWTHKTIANVPRPSSYYGEEFRQLFKARPGMQWVGWDASALEARVEAHYVYPLDQAYAAELVEGDVHQRNLDNISMLGDRSTAKMFKYAVTYGAQPAKLASSLGCSKSDATDLFQEFWQANPALAELRERLYSHWSRNSKKFIMGIDGRPILTRSEHSLLNALFQSAGAIVMKYSMIIAHNKIRSLYTEDMAYGLIRYHDEEVWECVPECSASIAKIGPASIVAAGKYLGMNVPLAGEAKVGNNWLEVH